MGDTSGIQALLGNTPPTGNEVSWLRGWISCLWCHSLWVLLRGEKWDSLIVVFIFRAVVYFGVKEFMLEVSLYILKEIYYDKYISLCSVISACLLSYFYIIHLNGVLIIKSFWTRNVISENKSFIDFPNCFNIFYYATYIVHLLQIIEYILFQIIIDKNAKETKLIKVLSYCVNQLMMN